MKRLRWWWVAFFVWLFVFYNIERLHEPINIASFTYILAAAAALAVILIPRLQRIALPWLLVLVIPAVVTTRLWLGYKIGGADLPITITEIFAVGITIFLARRIGQGLEEFREAVVRMMMNGIPNRTRPFESGQQEIYREIRRARHYQRPLSLLAISADRQSAQVKLDSLVGEIQRETVGQYFTAQIAEFLSNELKTGDIITHRDGHFVTLLPEVDREKAAVVVQKLAEAARAKLGVELKIGVSTFPDEEVTFVRLLENAEILLKADDHRPPKSVASAAGHGVNGNGAGRHTGDGDAGHSKKDGNGRSGLNGNGNGIRPPKR